MKQYSEVVRTAIWYTLVLIDPRMTVRRALREEALQKVVEGGDVVLVDALRPFSELLKALTEKQ